MQNLKCKSFFFLGFLAIIYFLSSSCSQKNYINYYTEVNKVDSILRYEQDSLLVVRKYRKLFRRYPPKNQDRIEEFETFITLAEKQNLRFGGRRALRKFAHLYAPYGNSYKHFTSLYDKYGLDEIAIEQEVVMWRRNLNKRLVDSFSQAFTRNEINRRSDPTITALNDKKDANLLKWTFENYGYPSVDRIGVMGNGNVFMPMDNFIGNLIGSESYSFFDNELFKAVQTGECPPRIYGLFVDLHHVLVLKENPDYGVFETYDTVIDTVFVNHNRKKIGLPSLQHRKLILRASNLGK